MFWIQIDGHDYPMKYGHGALKRFMQKYGLKRMIEITELPQKLTLADMPAFVHAGFETAAMVLAKDVPFTLEEVEQLLESNLWLETAAIEAFAQSMERPQMGNKAKADNGQHSDEVEILADEKK